MIGHKIEHNAESIHYRRDADGSNESNHTFATTPYRHGDKASYHEIDRLEAD
jgi:hypothetical protein